MTRRIARGREGGAITIMVIVLALVMFGLVAFVVDLGLAKANRRAAQAGADSAALGAAGTLMRGGDGGAVVSKVKDYAESAYGIAPQAWPGCQDDSALAERPDSANNNTCISYDTTTKLVQVRMPVVQQPSFFAGMLGASSPSVGAFAQATWSDDNAVRCVFCILGDYDGQNGTLNVAGGNVAINGDVTFTGNADDDGGINVASGGSIGVAGSGLPQENHHLQPDGTKIAPFSDPLAGLAPWPPTGVVPDNGAVTTNGTGVCSSGAYYSVENCTSFQTGGVFTIVGPTKIAGNGNAIVTGTDVLFYFTCATSSGNGSNASYRVANCADGAATAQGSFEGAGSGNFTLTGKVLGSLGQFVFVYDRQNDATLKLAGNAGSALVGGIYGASATLDNRGTGSAGGLSFDGLAVVNNVSFSGQDEIRQNYTGNPQTLIAPLPPHLTM